MIKYIKPQYSVCHWNSTCISNFSKSTRMVTSSYENPTEKVHLIFSNLSFRENLIWINTNIFFFKKHEPFSSDKTVRLTNDYHLIYICIDYLRIFACGFPFQNTDYALLVILPKSKESGSLDKILEKLSKVGITELTENLAMKPAFVTMPCFQSSNITSIKTVLQEVRHA